jgi:hypothetical protein
VTHGNPPPLSLELGHILNDASGYILKCPDSRLVVTLKASRFAVLPTGAVVGMLRRGAEGQRAGFRVQYSAQFRPKEESSMNADTAKIAAPVYAHDFALEIPTTVSLLQSIPASNLSYRPDDKSRSASTSAATSCLPTYGCLAGSLPARMGRNRAIPWLPS